MLSRKDLLLYLLVVNILAFSLYGIDKYRAVKKQCRISEAHLLGVAAVGGSVGAYLGMQVFHHKTKKPKFYIGVPVIFMIQALFAVWWLWILN